MSATMAPPGVAIPGPTLGRHFAVVAGGSRVVWRVSLGLLALQLAGMLVFTTVQYGRFNLTTDFAAYSQAWAAIGHGHLNPYSSVYGLSFWRNDFELLMWPLAIFYWVYPHAVSLLWLQALAVVGGEVVVLSWARETLVKARTAQRNASWILGLVALLLVATPWSWFTIGFDFHLMPFVAVFALLTARDLWAGRTLRLWLWAILTLCCAAASGAFCVMAVGVAGLLTLKRSRWTALALVVAAFAWLGLASAMGAMGFRGLALGPMYGYLAGDPTGNVGLGQVVSGLLRHPTRGLQMVRSHDGFLAGYVASGGVIGLRSWWGAVPAAFILLPSALNANPDFIHFAGAFQSWPAVLFLVTGVLFALQRLAGSGPAPGGALLLGGCTFAAAAAVMGLYIGQVPTYLQRVTPVAVQKLAYVDRRIPARSEVVASQGVIGRFGAGRTAYPYWADGAPEQYTVGGPETAVVFIFAPEQGTAEGLASETRQAIGYVKSRLHAQQLEEGAGIWSFVWRPAVGTRSVILP